MIPVNECDFIKTDHVEDCDQSAVLAKLLDAQNVYMTILEQFILRIEQAIKTNRQNQVNAIVIAPLPMLSSFELLSLRHTFYSLSIWWL